MIQMKLALAIIFSSLLFTACHFNSQFVNRNEDIQEAEKVTDKFYELKKVKKFKETTDLFSNDFYNVTDTSKLIKILTMTTEKLGNLMEVKIDQSNSVIISGTDPSSKYNFIYKNKYEKFEATETITLIKESDGKIKIIGYNINSDGFLLGD
jgi:hypothetical protein